MNKWSLILAAWAMGAAPWVHASEVKLPDGDVQYQIVVEHHGGEDKAAKRKPAGPDGKEQPDAALESINVTRYKTVILYQMNWEGGRTSEVMQHTSSNTILDQNLWTGDVVVGREGYISLPRLARSTKKSVDWISSKNYVKDVEREGKVVRLYQQEVTVMELPEGNSASGYLRPRKVTYRAWVDPETSQPVAMDDGEFLYEFGDAQPFAGPFKMPEAFRQPWQRLRARLTSHGHL